MKKLSLIFVLFAIVISFSSCGLTREETRAIGAVSGAVIGNHLGN